MVGPTSENSTTANASGVESCSTSAFNIATAWPFPRSEGSVNTEATMKARPDVVPRDAATSNVSHDERIESAHHSHVRIDVFANG